MRTTIDIDEPILEEIKRLKKEQGRPMGRIVSDLLAQSLAGVRAENRPEPFHWQARPMRARVDLADLSAVYDAMERSDGDGERA